MTRASVLLLLAAALLATPASAQPAPPDDARTLFLAGREAYRLENYPLAIRSFEQAWARSREPGLLFNLGQARRKLYYRKPSPQLLEEAIDAYQRYSNESPDGPNVAQAQQFIGELGVLQAESAMRAKRGPKPAEGAPAETPTELLVIAEGISNATLSLDGGAPRALPFYEPVAPGDHRILIEAPGYLPLSTTRMVPQGRYISFEATLSPRPGRLSVEGDRGASVSVDGAAPVRLPLRAALELPPGAHQLIVTKLGHVPRREAFDVSADRDVQLRVPLRETTQRKAARILAIAAGVAGAAAIGSGAVWGQAAWNAGVLERQRTTIGDVPSATWAEHDAYAGRAEGAQTITWTTLGLGLGLGLLSGALYLFDDPPPPDRN